MVLFCMMMLTVILALSHSLVEGSIPNENDRSQTGIALVDYRFFRQTPRLVNVQRYTAHNGDGIEWRK